MAIQYETIAVSTRDGAMLPVQFFSESDSLAAKRGQWVQLDANGKLDDATGISDLVGILAADAKNTTSDTSDGTPVVLAEPNVVFEAQVWHSTAASAVTARNQQGKAFAVKIGAGTNIDGIDIVTAAAGTDQATVVGVSAKDALGAVHGRVLFQINQDAYQLAQRIAH